MKRTRRDHGNHPADMDQLIDDLTIDAYGDEEQLWAFCNALRDGIAVPCDAFVIGEPVVVLGFDYDGNPLRGLVARCRRPGGSEYVIAACDVVLDERTERICHLYMSSDGFHNRQLHLRRAFATHAEAKSRCQASLAEV